MSIYYVVRWIPLIAIGVLLIWSIALGGIKDFYRLFCMLVDAWRNEHAD